MFRRNFVNQFIKGTESMRFDQIMEVILKELSISCEEDIDTKLSVDSFGFIDSNLVNEATRVMLYLACKSLTDNAAKAHSNKKQFFFHKSMFFDENTDYFNTYATLFPKRIVLYTPDLYLNGKVKIKGTRKEIGRNLGAGTSIIRYYLRHKELINNGNIFIFPQSVYDISKDSKYVKVPNFSDNKNKCFLDPIGNKIEIVPNTDHLNLVVELPWLRNARVEDFIELREKYKTEYELFSLQTDKLMLAARNGDPIEIALAKEYNEAVLEIRNTIVKQRAILKRSGVEAAVGSICTVVPVVLEQIGFDYFDPKVIGSIVGGTTIYGGIKNYFENSNKERENPYWILYQWEQKTNQ